MKDEGSFAETIFYIALLIYIIVFFTGCGTPLLNKRVEENRVYIMESRLALCKIYGVQMMEAIMHNRRAEILTLQEFQELCDERKGTDKTDPVKGFEAGSPFI